MKLLRITAPRKTMSRKRVVSVRPLRFRELLLFLAMLLLAAIAAAFAWGGGPVKRGGRLGFAALPP